VKWMLLMSLTVIVVTLPAEAGRHADSRAITIRLTSETTNIKTVIDRAPKGKPNKGDVAQVKSSLRNSVAQFGRPKDVIVGSDVSTYTLVSLAAADVTAVAKLPGGTIQGGGRIRFEKRRRAISVTGGTGAFAGARGTLETSANANLDLWVYVYRLQLP
jgi:hypothetical protein